MNISNVTIMIIAAIACIFSIASTAIGVEAYDKNPEWKEAHKTNFHFLVFNLVVAIIVLVLSLAGLGLHFYEKKMF